MQQKEHWPITVIPYTILGYLVMILILGVIAFALHNTVDLPFEILNVMLYGAQVLFTVMLLWGLARIHRIRNFWKTTGAISTSWRNMVLLPLGVYFCVIFLLSILQFLTETLNISLPGLDGEKLDPRNIFGYSTYGFIVSFFIASLIAPILEEVLFRGVVLGSLLHKVKPVPAILTSAVIFAVIHMQPGVIIPLTIQGIAMGWLFYHTGSIYPGIMYHILNNSVAIFVFFYVLPTLT